MFNLIHEAATSVKILQHETFSGPSSYAAGPCESLASWNRYPGVHFLRNRTLRLLVVVLSDRKTSGDKCPSTSAPKAATMLRWEAPHHKPGAMSLFPEIPLGFWILAGKSLALRAFMFPSALCELLLGECWLRRAPRHGILGQSSSC